MAQSGPVGPPTVPASPAPERVLMRTRPHAMFVVLGPLGPLAGIVLATGLAAHFAPRAGEWLGAGPTRAQAWSVGGLVLALRLLWQAIDWAMRDYVLTDRRVAATRGVFRRVRVDLPLSRVQHTVLVRSVGERLAGLGTIGVATAGTAGIELAWVMVDRPGQRLEAIRSACAGATQDVGGPAAPGAGGAA